MFQRSRRFSSFITNASNSRITAQRLLGSRSKLGLRRRADLTAGWLALLEVPLISIDAAKSSFVLLRSVEVSYK